MVAITFKMFWMSGDWTAIPASDRAEVLTVMLVGKAVDVVIKGETVDVILLGKPVEVHIV